MTDSLTLQAPDSPDVVHHDGGVYLRVPTPLGRPALYLLPPVPQEFDRIDSIVMDMDGSSTDTEKLVLRAMRDMMWEIQQDTQFKFADKNETDDGDYPHIIGDSTTNHVRYLLSKYGGRVDDRKLSAGYLRALRRHGKVKSRFEFMERDFVSGDRKVFEDSKLRELLSSESMPLEVADKTSLELTDQYNVRMDRLQGAIDIYYANYHIILEGIRDGSVQEALIEPMPFLAEFLSVSKELGIKLGLVTSSVQKEAEIVMPIVFQGMGFDTPLMEYYDCIVTASNNEMENYLKPHPMLYDIALTSMGYQHQNQRNGSFGVEDSTAGLKSVRAAGISAVAVIHPGTKNHDKSFANLGTARLDGQERGGLRDVMVRSKLFLKEGSEQRKQLDEILWKIERSCQLSADS
ncbi:MAG: HAD hydrolase-like protein [Armatimonadota bacterium]|nr:HAD hydrolase-like protein [Armatimonadota bacterium]